MTTSMNDRPARSQSSASTIALRAAGCVQILLSSLAGLGLLASYPLLAMCTDAGSSSDCDSVAGTWLASGVLVLANLVAGIALMCVDGSSRRARHLVVAVASCLAVTAVSTCASLLG
ncbi:hypothetical protein [uncultured Jatrophihabitans sp.]|uniref:hypothetical protein n=1 Tax=uncultured Jatrophihabitans sp. TaxID=1610747 RepID=UPI0035CBC016